MPDVREKGMEHLRWAVTRVLLAERMHWTLDYVDSMSDQDISDTLTVLAQTDKAKANAIRKR